MAAEQCGVAEEQATAEARYREVSRCSVEAVEVVLAPEYSSTR